MDTATIEGRKYVLVPEGEYKQLKAGTKAAVEEADLPPLPKRNRDGHFPAVEYARALLARKLITAIAEARMTQADVARAAGIQPAVLNRILKAKVTADGATVTKIEAALGR